MSVKSTGLIIAAVSVLALTNFAVHAYGSSSSSQTGTSSSGMSSTTTATTATREQIDACSDKKDGDSCTFTINYSSKTGTCQKGSDNSMACRETTGSTSVTTP